VFSKEVCCVLVLMWRGCLDGTMVEVAISEGRGRRTMRLMHNSIFGEMRVLMMSDLQKLCGRVMLSRVFWRRKWWRQFNSCVET
jgi:hypothetical protein